jgi:hypothetical protein
MFTSDNNKRFNMLAKMKDADAATRAKTVAAVALNTLISAAVTTGTGVALSAAGRAITGAQKDPKEAERDKRNFALNALSGLLSTAYFGDDALDLVRATAGGQDVAIVQPDRPRGQRHAQVSRRAGAKHLQLRRQRGQLAG